MPLEDVLLVLGGEFAEVAAPAPDAHDQVAVQLRVGLCIKKRFNIQAVELQLLATQLSEGLYRSLRKDD
jgi:hypothetical protein